MNPFAAVPGPVPRVSKVGRVIPEPRLPLPTGPSRRGQGYAPRPPRFGRAGGALLALLAAEVRAAPEPMAPAAILQELRSFREMGSVLYVAAHPDDENTQLTTYLSRGRGYRTAYLSVTRGDGGQNEIGPEFGEKLGVARTQELLAARRLDGGQQFFTRALDFGYSKDYRETLNLWNRQEVLADIVRIIRAFRPDVVITRFSPVPSATHGQHTASAVLALEAFTLAGDAKAFPEQLDKLALWRPRRILQNSGGGGRGLGGTSNPAALRLEVSGNDPVTDEPFGAIAVRSRAMHKTQGFGGFTAVGSSGPRQESFTLLGGDPATKDILDGVDSTWRRFAGGAEIGRLADEAIAQFKLDDPAASVPALLAIRHRAAALPADRVVDEKLGQLDRILQLCLGLTAGTAVPEAEVVPGEILKLRHSAAVLSGVPVRWVAVRYPSLKTEIKIGVALSPGQPESRDSSPTLPAGTLPSQPYWLRAEGSPGMFRVDDASLIGRPENPPAFPVEQVFEVGGQTLVVADEPIQTVATASEVQARRKLEVIPPVSLRCIADVELWAPGATKTAAVELTAARAGTSGSLHLDVPPGWSAAPASQSFRLAGAGDRTELAFHVTAPAHPDTGNIRAVAEVNGAHFDHQRVVIRYAHIPVQLLQPAARCKVVALNLATRGHRIGYLPGAGDSVAASLVQMGYAVTQLTGAELTTEKLSGLDAVVIGVRAFNERSDLAGNLPGLFAYVEAGGTVIAQYNRPNGLKTPRLGPYPLSIAGDPSRNRVTDENSPVVFLAPDHPALTTPNRIVPADFDGWVQERGAYFPSSWDAGRYAPVLAMNDPGEAPLTSSLLVARHGQGYFVYAGLAFFRQLPAGVPGAYRLFANLVSLGK
ncbi:MAG: LmbE family protein [Opitutaceae bacterium]|nr:LmbE family protein [Opitutaceae bacterium]